MRTLALWLDYDGTDYRGFGVQPRQRTVQGVLERALLDTVGEAVRVTGAARTDAGVHARGQVVSLRTQAGIRLDALPQACNARLPSDVVVTRALEMAPGFDARRAARRRSYRYAIWNAPLPCLWQRRFQHHVRKPLDLAAMTDATASLLGTHDFRPFAAELDRSADLATTRTVSRAEWSANGPLLWFDITADSFLRHMVRVMVGTLLQVGRRVRDARDVEAILLGRERQLAGPNAPASGLSLMGVEFE